MKNILIIKYGALGDFFQALHVFETIRYHFPNQKITLLTRPLYKDLAKATGYFDHIIEDDRPSLFSLKNWSKFYKLYQALQNFDFIFDFQNAQRTKLYFYILHYQTHFLRQKKSPLWSGQIKQASHPHLNPHIKSLHTLARQEEQLKSANLTLRKRSVPLWASSLTLSTFLEQHTHIFSKPSKPSKPYVILVPGAASHRPRKYWPIERFKDLISSLKKEKLRCIIIGDEKQKNLGEILTQYDPESINLMGKTSMTDLTYLIARAALVIGNDTGPLHISAALDRFTLTLFSHESDPRRTAPITISPHKSRILSAPDLAQLSSQNVISLLEDWAYPHIHTLN